MTLGTVLVVDDTEDIRELLRFGLTHRGFTVVTAMNAEEMDAYLAHSQADIVVLDLMLPGEDGFSICRRLSERGGPPVLILSARREDLAKLDGFAVGADDYMVKPFNMDELAARLQVIMRRNARAESARSGATWRFSGWLLEQETRNLTGPSGKTLCLSTAEFAFFRALLETPDRPMKRSAILSRMSDVHGFSTSRALDTLVWRLRQKLDFIEPVTETETGLIQTVYGAGYMLGKSRGQPL